MQASGYTDADAEAGTSAGTNVASYAPSAAAALPPSHEVSPQFSRPLQLDSAPYDPSVGPHAQPPQRQSQLGFHEVSSGNSLCRPGDPGVVPLQASSAAYDALCGQAQAANPVPAWQRALTDVTLDEDAVVELRQERERELHALPLLAGPRVGGPRPQRSVNNMSWRTFCCFILSKRWKLKAILSFFALFFLVSVAVIFLSTDAHFRSKEFKPAVPVDVVSYKKTGAYEHLRVEMSRYLSARPKSCGITAPNFRYYVNYMVVRSSFDSKGVEEMFNIRILRFHDRDKTSLIRATSHMCHKKYMPTGKVGVSGTVTIEYENYAGITTSREVSGSISFCVQHYVDVLLGKWPCLVGQVRIPMYPSRVGHGEL